MKTMTEALKAAKIFGFPIIYECDIGNLVHLLFKGESVDLEQVMNADNWADGTSSLQNPHVLITWDNGQYHLKTVMP